MHTNRLSREKSPYLLQHAHNPVDWYPWGQEAFERARAEDKPIFLSIGYSTCHWCHVMERESFEDERIAALLNEHFVPVKVDREERPDVDRIYMLFVQATTGSGGWPMSVWLTPDLKPFFGGTYFPPEDRYGRPGFAAVLRGIAEVWQRDRQRVLSAGESVLEELRRQVDRAMQPGAVDQDVLERGFFYFRRTYDPLNGGFGGAPKFPRPCVFTFLLREYARNGNQEALEMTLNTLRAMAQGGIHDRLGGGFHRYSVDEQWRVPHYEKMLYDQAQLAVAYLEAYQITGEPELAEVARGILDYVLRDMTSPDGGFYSAEDADSAVDLDRLEIKEEGAFYLWPEGVLEKALADPVEKQRLLAERARRPRPERDDKILTAWNGLMISAFAMGGQVLNKPRYAEAARRSADFVLRCLYDPQQRILLRRFRNGEAAIEGFLEDYAFLVQALLDLYETCFEPRDLQKAIELTERMRELFEDREQGGFFAAPGARDGLVLQLKDADDGAEPSGNSVAAMNLLRLTQYTEQDELRRCAVRVFECFAATLNAAPGALPAMLAAIGFHRAKVRQIVLAGAADAADTRALLAVVRRKFLPYKVVLLADRDETRGRLSLIHPAIAGMTPVEGKAAAYVCEDYTCRLPVTTFEELERALG
ncbi:MAG: thioredoxin domain-containing protein [Bryobacteraceae bacterium]